MREGKIGPHLVSIWLALASLVFVSLPSSAQSTSWHRLIDQGDQYELTQKHAAAEAVFVKALQEAEKIGPHVRETQETLPRLATACVMQGKFNAAEGFYQRSMKELADQTQPRKSAEALVWLDDLSDAYQEKATTTDFAFCMQHCIKIRDAIAPQHKHSKLASALDSLAAFYTQHRQYSEAEPVMKEEVAVLEEQYGQKSSRLAVPIGNLAAIEIILKKYALAQGHYDRALKILNQNPQLNAVHISLAQQELSKVAARKKSSWQEPR